MEDGRVQVVARRSFMGCIGCGQCTTVCPTGSVRVEGRRFDMGDVVDLPPAAAWATTDQLDGLMLSRRSVRRFRQDEIDRATVDRILAMTSTAPTGIPPTEVGILVFHGRDKVRQFVSETMDVFRRGQKMFRPLSLLLLRPFLGKATCQLLRTFVRPLIGALLAAWDRGEDLFCYGSPLLLLFYAAEGVDDVDSSIAATHAMLAAQSFGLGSCMLGTTTMLNQSKAFKAKYGISEKSRIGLGLTIGRPAVEFQRGIRRKMEAVKFA
jgi:nitroreductase